MRKEEIRLKSNYNIEHSSGGIVYTTLAGETYWLFLCEKGKLVIPKGHIEHNENSIDAATREIKEETGIKIPVDHLRFIIDCTHTFTNQKGVEIVKQVDFHLFQVKESEQLPEINKKSCWVKSCDELIFKYSNHQQIYKTASSEINNGS